jgi:hypothetical protein
MEIMGCKIRTVERVVHRILALALQPVTGSASSTEINDFHIFGALKKNMFNK